MKRFKLKLWGRNLRLMRKAAKKTTQQMADHISVCRATYENWERDVGRPKIDQFFFLMLFCSMNIDSIQDQFDKLNDDDLTKIGRFDDESQAKATKK